MLDTSGGAAILFIEGSGAPRRRRAKMAKRTTKRVVRDAKTGEILREYEPRATGRMIACEGAAHSNPHIDHCMLCLGHAWGKVPELAPVDLEAAKAAGEVVSF